MVRGTDSGLLLTADCPTDVPGVNGDTLWSVEQMQAYFAMIQSLNPVMTEDASRVLQAYYCAQRRSDEGRSAARTSVRLLQSMIRLAQGDACCWSVFGQLVEETRHLVIPTVTICHCSSLLRWVGFYT